ncbi:MAG: fatty acid desaturase [Silicimonas sp.]|nr:fatty acid desaturase [Silicimonas sp.]
MTTKFEIPTLALLAATYALWAGALFWSPGLSLWLAIPLLALTIAQQSSLQHEIIHGHPTPSRALNTALGCPPLTLVIPYLRFRDTHLAHHRDSRLTDPYDDPESNFLDGGDWERLPRALRRLLLWNNTLLGRLTLGPILGTLHFLRSDWTSRHDPRVMRGWLWHLPGLAVLLALILLSPTPLWAYVLAAYLALALLRIRTFLEHRAHEASRARSVIIEDRGPLALLFLNNNLHAVHHMHPNVPWYDLPGLLRTDRARYLNANDNYHYRSYAEIFRRYFLTRKDPVAHPLWRR